MQIGTSFNAQDWAREFVASVRENPSIATDEGTMVGWFANAIMRGYDDARASLTPSSAATPHVCVGCPNGLDDCYPETDTSCRIKPNVAATSALVVGEPCPTCKRKYLGEMGPGEYSCVLCGMGLTEPCEHLKNLRDDSSTFKAGEETDE